MKRLFFHIGVISGLGPLTQLSDSSIMFQNSKRSGKIELDLNTDVASQKQCLLSSR